MMLFNAIMGGILRGALLFSFGVDYDMAIYKDYGTPPSNNSTDRVVGLNGHSQRGNGGFIGDGKTSQFDFGRFKTIPVIAARYGETPVEYNVSANVALPVGYLPDARQKAIADGEINLILKITLTRPSDESPDVLTVVYNGSAITADEDQVLDAGEYSSGNNILVITPETAGDEIYEYVVSLDAAGNLLITGGSSAEAGYVTITQLTTSEAFGDFDGLLVVGFADPVTGLAATKAELNRLTGADTNAYQTAASSQGFLSLFNPPPFGQPVGGEILGWWLAVRGESITNFTRPVRFTLDDPDNLHNASPDTGQFQMRIPNFTLTGANWSAQLGRILELWTVPWTVGEYNRILNLTAGRVLGASAATSWQDSSPVLNWNSTTLYASMDHMLVNVQDWSAPIFKEIFGGAGRDINFNSYPYLRKIDSSSEAGASCCGSNIPNIPSYVQEDPWVITPNLAWAPALHDIVWLPDVRKWQWALDFNAQPLWTTCP